MKTIISFLDKNREPIKYAGNMMAMLFVTAMMLFGWLGWMSERADHADTKARLEQVMRLK